MLFAAWIALVAGSSVAPSWVGAAAAWWCLWFVPRWRFGALPAIAERNPLWGHALQGSARSQPEDCWYSP